MKKRFQVLAKIAAERSTYSQRVGAVAVRKNRVLTSTCNLPRKTHPQAPTPFKTLHAEVAAVFSAGSGTLRGAEVYVCRIRADGTTAIAKPCPDCETLLRQEGVRRIFYTTGETDQPWATEDYHAA